ncbi:MAG: hypothetical protein L6R39_004466 [Caloplaca ligustica]|nr:MAG: hypothetical protein L6R39_004466 [Caloplaca ligustica]
MEKSPLKQSGLLMLPVEVRLQILRHLVCAEPWRFCPHTRLPLMVFTSVLEDLTRYVGGPATSSPLYDLGWDRKVYPQPKACYGSNEPTLGVLRVCRKLYEEALGVLYSENILYLEQHFSWGLDRTPVAQGKSPILPVNLEKIPEKHLPLVRQIGFAVTDQSSIEPDFRKWEDCCSWIRKALPNLRHTYIFLFGPSNPSQRFLVRLVRFLDSIPGEKTIEYRASNNSKRMVGNTLAQVFRQRAADAPTIRILGGCYCQCWTPGFHLAFHGCRDFSWTRSNTLWPWLDLMKRDKHSNKRKNAIEGSITPQFSFKHKGPMIGCLLCHKRSNCVHDARLKPGRIKPNGSTEAAVFSMW